MANEGWLPKTNERRRGMLKIRVAVFALASLVAGSIPAVTSSVYILDENPPPAQIGVPYLGSA